MTQKLYIVCLCMLGQYVLGLGTTLAQDIEPRRWTPLPVGTQILGVGYGYSSGDVFFDPVLSIENADVDANTLLVSYVNSFSLGGKLARFDMLIPWQTARWDGLLDGVPASTERSGFADPIFRLSVNLAGAPTAESAELHAHMQAHPVNTIVGAALAVSVPVGDYYEDKLLNLGQNRFIVRPQIGVVHNRGPWSYELTGSIFFFSDNDEFFNGSTREQNPIYATQAHVIRMLKPGMWLSLSAGYGEGGRSAINGERKDDEKANFLSAVSMGYPLSRTQAVKFAYVRARTQKDNGADTDNLVFAWSMMY